MDKISKILNKSYSQSIDFLDLPSNVQYKLLGFLNIGSLRALRATCTETRDWVDQKRILERRILVHVKDRDQMEFLNKSVVPWVHFFIDCDFTLGKPFEADQMHDIIAKFVSKFAESIKSFNRCSNFKGCESLEGKNRLKNCEFGTKFLLEYGQFIENHPEFEVQLDSLSLCTIYIPGYDSGKLQIEKYSSTTTTATDTSTTDSSTTAISREKSEFKCGYFLKLALQNVKKLRLDCITFEYVRNDLSFALWSGNFEYSDEAISRRTSVQDDLGSNALEKKFIAKFLSFCPRLQEISVSGKIGAKINFEEISSRLEIFEFIPDLERGNVSAFKPQEFAKIYNYAVCSKLRFLNGHSTWLDFLDKNLERIEGVVVPIDQLNTVGRLTNLKKIFVSGDGKWLETFFIDNLWNFPNANLNLEELVWQFGESDLSQTNRNNLANAINWIFGVKRDRLKSLSIEWPQSSIKLPRLISGNKIAQNMRNLTFLTLIRWEGKNEDFLQIWENCCEIKSLVICTCPNLDDEGFFGQSSTSPAFLNLKKLKNFCLWTEEMPCKSFTQIFKWMSLEVFRFQLGSGVLEKILPIFEHLIGSPLSKSMFEMQISLPSNQMRLAADKRDKIDSSLRKICQNCQIDLRPSEEIEKIRVYFERDLIENSYFLMEVDENIYPEFGVDPGFGPTYLKRYYKDGLIQENSENCGSFSCFKK